MDIIDGYLGNHRLKKIEKVERKVGKDTITEINIETEEEFEGIKKFYTSRKMIVAKFLCNNFYSIFFASLNVLCKRCNLVGLPRARLARFLALRPAKQRAQRPESHQARRAATTQGYLACCALIRA